MGSIGIYKQAIHYTTQLLNGNERNALALLIQNFEEGNGIVQFAVAEIELNRDRLTTAQMETLIAVSAQFRGYALQRPLTNRESAFVRYVNNAWDAAYDRWVDSPEATAITTQLSA